MVTRSKTDQMPVLFLWHQHQPFYKLPQDERPILPWVRLHAVRGYSDMLYAAQTTGARVTFNFSSSLLEQLVAASTLEPADEFERLARIPARELTEDQRRFILTHFFSISWSVHVKPNLCYHAILLKRGERLTETAIKTALTDFSLQDYTDLIALFNLSWTGFAKRKLPEINELLRKGRNYTYEDIELILSVHRDAIREILPGYRQLQKDGQIEISSSPYAHPILPLLCDTKVASPDIPRQQLPTTPYQHPEDAEHHLQLAAKIYREIWDQPVRGLWPSEGSVSNEALELSAKAGFKWAASDQGVLARSDWGRESTPSHFISYDWVQKDQTIRCYFRDHALSDAIGFRYSTMSAESAVKEFVGHLETIEGNTHGTHGRCVVIALDGENPWESYPDGGESFLNTLFRTIESHPKLTTMTFSEHMEKGTREHIRSIHAGSWIDSNFHIWIGDPEKNQAWSELQRTRLVVDSLIAGDPRLEAAWEQLLKAQCSDWFWWFGEPFHSAYDAHYDELFRSFLKAVYAAIDIQYPQSLDSPIAAVRYEERRLQPAFTINPTIDGKETSFYEWMGASKIIPRQYGVMMGRSEEVIKLFCYGFSEKELFFRIDITSLPLHQRPQELVLHVTGDIQQEFSIPVNGTAQSIDGDGWRWVLDEILEIAIEFPRAKILPGSDCRFWLEIKDGTTLLEKLPPAGEFKVHLPTTSELAANWIV